MSSGTTCVVVTDPSTDPDLADVTASAIARLGAQVVTASTQRRVQTGNQATFELLRDVAGRGSLVVDLTRHGLNFLEADTSSSDDDGDSARLLHLHAGGLTLRRLATLRPHVGVARRVERAHMRCDQGATLFLSSDHGTDLRVSLQDAVVESHTGVPTADQPFQRFPDGRVLVTPARATVSGTVVLMPGDSLVDLGEYVRSPLTLSIKQDHVFEVSGSSNDTDLLRHVMGTGGSDDGFGIASIGVGLNASLPLATHDHALARIETPVQGLCHAGMISLTFGPNLHAGRASGVPLRVMLADHSLSVDDRPLTAKGELQGDIRPDIYESQ